jgi:hypothetical protein
VTSRTCDVLPMITRAAQIIHQGADFQERVTRLLFRLDLGIQGAAVGLAQYAGRVLDRSDYHRLCEARLTEPERLNAAEDTALQELLGKDLRKVAAVRDAVRRWVANRREGPPAAALPGYQQ